MRTPRLAPMMLQHGPGSTCNWKRTTVVKVKMVVVVVVVVEQVTAACV